MIKSLIALTALLFSQIAMANPTVFGLTINETTVEELKNTYSVTYSGQNKFSLGDMYDIGTSQIQFEGLQSVRTVFNQDGLLIAVLTGLPKARYNYLKSALAGKYTLVSHKTPFVGDKSAKFKSGNTEIEIDAPHMSFEMTMNYLHVDFLRAFRTKSANERQTKQKKESSML